MNRYARLTMVSGLVVALLTGGGAAAWADSSDAVAPPAAPDGTFTDLGQPITALTIHQSAMGKNAEGDDVVFSVLDGEDSPLQVVNLASGELEATVALPGSSGAWGITVTDDNLVYLGTYNTGRLFVYDPATGVATDLGRATPDAQLLYGLSASPDGKVYGGTYPNAHAFEYDPATGQFRDFGRIATDEQYVRSTAYDPVNGLLYAGASTNPRIYQIDTVTGAKKDVTPAPLKGLTSKTPYYMTYGDGKIYVNVENTLWALDAATGEAVTLTTADGANADGFPIGGMVSPASGGAVYFTGADGAKRYLKKLDTATDVITPLTDDAGGPLDALDPAIGFGWVDVDGVPTLYGKTGNYGVGGFAYTPATNALSITPLNFEPIPTRLMNVTVRPDTGDVYVNAYLNGSTRIIDPDTGESAQTLKIGQTEGWVWYGGKMYAGTYPNGSLLEYTPAEGSTAATSTTLFSLAASDQQNRPRGIVVTDSTIYVGTTPTAGLTGGALTVYDRAAKTFVVHRNVVQDQTVGSLLLDGTTLYGGTSIEGGDGATPVASEAKIFTWDTATNTKTAEYTVVPGAHAINGLTFGPDGNIWGMADGTVFSFDPATHSVVKTFAAVDGYSTSGDGHLVFHPNGYLYGSDRGQLFALDPATGQATILHSGVDKLVLSPTGTMYMLLKPVSTSYLMNLLSFTPGAVPGAVPAWDAATTYDGGESVGYEGAVYRALWWTQGQTPGDPSGPWSQLGEAVECAAGAATEWGATTVYTGGEIVAYDGRAYRAQWWTRNQTPGDPSGPWVGLGAC